VAKPVKPLTPAALQWIRDHPLLLCSCRRELLHLRLLSDTEIDIQHGENPEHQVSGLTHVNVMPDDVVFFIHGIGGSSVTGHVVVGGTWLAAVHARMFH
jgi:hypothetical protein